MNAIDREKLGYMLETPENSGMPKSENSTLAVNQQGRSLAYIIGVYFGDGYASHSYWNGKALKGKMFRLVVIDRDFRDYCAQNSEIAFPDRKSTRFETIKNEKKFYGLQISQYGSYLENITGKRTIIPNLIYKSEENKASFAEGLLDSEGWVQLELRGNAICAHIGFAITSDIVYEFKKLLEGLGVKSGKISTYTKNRAKPLKNISINARSFIESGLKFHCARKQERIDKYAMMIQMVDRTKRRDILNGTLRDFKPNSTEMIKSELHGDMKSAAEMPAPAFMQ